MASASSASETGSDCPTLASLLFGENIGLTIALVVFPHQHINIIKTTLTDCRYRSLLGLLLIIHALALLLFKSLIPELGVHSFAGYTWYLFGLCLLPRGTMPRPDDLEGWRQREAKRMARTELRESRRQQMKQQEDMLRRDWAQREAFKEMRDQSASRSTGKSAATLPSATSRAPPLSSAKRSEHRGQGYLGPASKALMEAAATRRTRAPISTLAPTPRSGNAHRPTPPSSFPQSARPPRNQPRPRPRKRVPRKAPPPPPTEEDLEEDKTEGDGSEEELREPTEIADTPKGSSVTKAALEKRPFSLQSMLVQRRDARIAWVPHPVES